MKKTFVILFEVESDPRSKDAIAANIRSALAGRSLNPSGIDVWEKGEEPIMRSRQRSAKASGPQYPDDFDETR